MSSTIEDFPHGPLDVYRQQASFDWKKLKVFLETEDVLRYQFDLYEKLKNNVSFRHPLQTLSLGDERYRTLKQLNAYRSLNLTSPDMVVNSRKQLALVRTATQLAPSFFIKTCMNFSNQLKLLGTERHAQFLEDALQNKIIGSFCMTEVGHGSNIKALRTKAIYDKTRKVFVIITPDFEAAKCWGANLGHSATHAIVFAQLEIDDKEYGLHSFIVPIRDVTTLLPFSGITVGDMGEKIGLNGIDNGFVIFNQFEIPRENLLNKFCDVMEDGTYVSHVRDEKIDKTINLASLSVGRISVIARCECLGTKALTIAIRYSAIRKQFGPTNDEEIPIIEYQTQQYRLFPYLASAYILRNISSYLADVQDDLDYHSKNGYYNVDITSEVHAISCGAKALAGWTMRDAIQESREACGGHGYLKVAGIGEIRNDHEAGLTYEGESYVILQQTSNFLIKLWPLVVQKKHISSPLESVNFLTNGANILKRGKFNAKNLEQLLNPNYLISIFDWMVVYLLRISVHKLEQDKIKYGKSEFNAKNNNQIFYANDLAIVFIERFFLIKMVNSIENSPDDDIRQVLTKLFHLYGLWCLEKHLPLIYQGKFANGPHITHLVHQGILRLLADLKTDAVALIDVIAPPDFILNSVLGYSDGLVYKHLQSSFYRQPNGMARPKWWQEILQTGNLQNKL